jgi:hypothetical protein
MNYIFCIRDEASKKSCKPDECWDAIFGKKKSADGALIGGAIDIDLKKMELTLDGEEVGTDIDSCAGLAPFIRETCKFGNACCKDCNKELTEFLDCVVTDVVLPFSRLAFNKSFTGADDGQCDVVQTHNNECTIRFGRRRLRLGDRLFYGNNLQTRLPKTVLTAQEIDEIYEGANICENALKWDMLVRDTDTATERFLTCLDLKAFEAMHTYSASNAENVPQTAEAFSIASMGSIFLAFGVTDLLL